MTRDETIALFLQGREAWNAWAETMLAECKALEEAGEWAAYIDPISGSLQGENDKTKDWITRASVDFSRCRVVEAGAEASSLPGADAQTQSIDRRGEYLDRHGAHVPRADDENDGLKTIEVADRFACSGFIFPANASFDFAQFHANAFFANAQFHAIAFFTTAQFHGRASFARAQFHDEVRFLGAQFHAEARFDRAQFHAPARFDDAQFHKSATASFDSAQFQAAASFHSAQFHARAWFNRAHFHADANFLSAQFHDVADFYKAQFYADANFQNAQFQTLAYFNSAQFHTYARFNEVYFHTTAFFASAQFHAAAPSFNQVRFEGPAFFIGSRFAKGADFRSMRSEVGFDMSSAEFGRVPDFTQTTLHRDPRLDNVTVKRGSIIGPVWREARSEYEYWKLLGIWTIRHQIDRDAPAKFRELKRFAIQGEDHRSELQFHAHEIRNARFVNDFPLRHPRFWFGVGYEILSNFGRSIIRPIIAWALVLVVFATYYMGQTPDIARERDLMIARGASTLGSYVRIAPTLFQETRCSTASPNDRLRRAQLRIGRQTSATNEAWSLAVKNGFVFIDWDRSEAARRTYGCLYGLTTDDNNTFPVVPHAVSTASLIQNVISAVLIFLLLLGIRNLLKLK